MESAFLFDMETKPLRGDSVRAVMDTNVLVAALRSRHGASFEVLRRLRLGQWTAVLSNHLLFTHNVRDLQPATRLGVGVLSPRDFLAKLQE